MQYFYLRSFGTGKVYERYMVVSIGNFVSVERYRRQEFAAMVKVRKNLWVADEFNMVSVESMKPTAGTMALSHGRSMCTARKYKPIAR